ncbi:MAG: indolepyruvate oxidoreductase subunit beta [Dorea sp.]|jgi:indolepyruvate ferredoxin oxidoreductase beta subunit|nr:indolepyruvate oxidoreductase subunit beta [Dorea sp.]
MNKNIVLCGVGGQGTVLASKLIAAAAMKKGLSVMSAETIGMAQRGGSVFSHVRIGEDVCSPMIARGSADLIVGFEPGEAVRMLPFLKEGGQVVTSSRAILPVTASLSGSSYNGEDMVSYLKRHVENLLVVDSEKACGELGSPKALNILLLGAAVSSGRLGFTEEDIKDAIAERLPERFHKMNFAALEYMRLHP